ncbi:MATE family efflux transporter [Bradyrhizobium sp. LHD-71]|uniref:MATE family efflux transporter n=1 Tax=Bradyrhizobium sp. LHD-71 TaxID=3072141 RepID=UPI00280D00DF|nr:MATE family efflux transporter [Bradyrhizobium sp. LHD-71]MDQ8728947.1 MATE family efflux transporter [Bradyrhizobium sp. LHD-71]
MADLGQTEIAAAEPPAPAPRARPVRNPILDGAITPTLLRLATPNIIAMGAGISVLIAETTYIGILGIAPLAAIALMFPLIILMMTMSGGAMGGGVASAIARALGAGDTLRASTLALHALAIGLAVGATFSIALLNFGEQLLTWMGGRGAVLAEALAFAQIYFSGVVLIWLMNTLVAILRGTGNMILPSAIVFSSAVCQIVFGGVLSLGLFGVPQLGIRGIAVGQLSGVAVGVLVMGWFILSGRSRITLRVPHFRFHREMFTDILKVGALACFYPVQSVLTAGMLASMLAQYGPEVLAAYGIGARLEFFLTSIAFSCGVASVPMVGMAVGAGQIARARRVAWTGAVISALGVGALVAPLAIFPDLWTGWFTDDPFVRKATGEYLLIAGPMFSLLGVGVSLYFSSQGAAKVLGSVLAQTVRLSVVIFGGFWLLSVGAEYIWFFVLAGAAMAAFGLFTAVAVHATSWGTELRATR